SKRSIATATRGLGPVLARRYHADRTRGAGKQPASLRWLRYPVGSTHRGQTRDHRHRAEGIESHSQHEHLRSRRFVRSNHCGHERGHARQYRRDVVTHARLAGSQSASRAWLWPPVNGGSILCSLNVKTARWWRAIVSFTHLAREGRMTVTIGRRELLADSAAGRRRGRSRKQNRI